MKLFKSSILFLLTLLVSLPASYAQDTATQNIKTPENLVKIRLVAERAHIQPGDEIWIATEQSIPAHWHTYWKNPGDSGTPTRITWDLPTGFEIGEIQWPTPKRLPYGPLLNYGYENNPILLQKLTIPSDIPAGEITLTANIEILACKEECIPEYGTHTLTLNGTESLTENNTGYIQMAIEKLPLPVSAPAAFYEENGNFTLNIALGQDVLDNIKTETLAFFPADWGIIQNPATLTAAIKNDTLTIIQPRGERALQTFKSLNGVIAFESKNGIKQGFEITANAAAPPLTNTAATAETPHPTPTPHPTTTLDITLAKALLFALLGGIILNLMPCVFPVLSMKALSLVKTADKHPNRARKLGLAYTLGVILSFMIIAATLLALKQAGAQIGWGFQLQDPGVIIALSFLLFTIGLNFMGFFEIPGNIANFGCKTTQSEGVKSSFFTGILATIVASPCTAPFMAGAIGFALTQPAWINLIIFAALGLGLALPYLLLSFIPALQRLMPKPGAWMCTFREILAFPMFLSAIWLVWVLSQQTGPVGILHALLGMTAIVFGIWILKHRGQGKIKRTITLLLALIAFAVTGLAIIMEQKNTAIMTGDYEAMKFGKNFSAETLETLLATNDPVFVEMTAAWCITCKVNHAIGVDIPQTRETFKKYNVTFVIGDWTNQDPQITQYLNTFGRNGVPIYVYYGPRNPETGSRPPPQVLPQILKPNTISNLFKENNEL